MRRAVPPVIVVALGVAVALLAFQLGSTTRSDLGTVAAAPEPTSPSPASSQQPVAAPSAADTNPTAAARAFVRAFLDRGDSRDNQLAAVTSDRLRQLLARTDPAKLPDGTPVGEPSAVGVSEMGTTVTQRLSDGTSVTFDLVPDHRRRYGWVVTSVRPGKR